MINGHTIYSRFINIRRHLTEEHFNYANAKGIRKEKYLNIRDKVFADSLARNAGLDNQTSIHFILFNMVAYEGDLKKYWIGELIKPEAKEIYTTRQRYWESMMYYYNLDFWLIVDTAELRDQYSPETMVELYLQKQIHPETVAVTARINKPVADFLLDKDSGIPYNEAIKLIKYGQLMQIDTEHVLSELKRK